MKILVFEYITGGGFNRQELSESLAHEGRLMLQALLDNLRSLAGQRSDVSVVVMLDDRVNGSINTAGFDTVIIGPEQDSHEEFARLALCCDAIWPIAPEFDGILEALCQTVELSGKLLLTSPARAVALTGNKLKTYQHFRQHHIATVPTRLFTGEAWDNRYLPGLGSVGPTRKIGQWLVKPVDGVGCADSYILTERHHFEQMHAQTGRYVIQPHIQGKKTSLSCLFKDGRGWLLCVNLQQFDIVSRQYQLSKIIVNHPSGSSAHRLLVDHIARALPELWGYAGIDLIETPDQLLVLEINPRLTTSFAGIHSALGINIAENVLQLLHGKPSLKAACDQPITIHARQNESE